MEKKKRLSIFTIIIVIFLSGSLIVLLLMLNQMNKNIEKLTVKFVQIEKEMEITNEKNRELNDFETKNLIEIDNIYSTYDSNFLKHATAINAPLFRIPDVTSEKVGIVNDTVLIYNTYLVKDNMRNTERWVYVEYVIIDLGETQTLEAYFNEEVKLIVSHWKDEAQINSIEIVKM